MAMDLSSDAPLFSSQGVGGGVQGGGLRRCLKNPFLDPNNLRGENPESKKCGYVEIGGDERWLKSVTVRNVLEAPPTPGRPIFSFSTGRKSLPSKWDDAEKWVVAGTSSSSSSSPAAAAATNYHGFLLRSSMDSSRTFQKSTAEDKLSSFEGSLASIQALAISSPATDITLKDKFTQQSDSEERFLFDDSSVKTSETAVRHRDVGTEMTPLGSSTTSRCPTPFKNSSPARHNTPADRSGPLADNTIDVTELQECHLVKLSLGSQFDLAAASNWSTREEEEEDVSKSLRHFELNSECRKSVSESRYCGWEEEEKAKSCFRYQREEARIQAWINLQSAKAEAESRRLEVKIQKMRSNLEEKLMKTMADVHRKAEEWRATALFQHSEQIRRVDLQAKKVSTRNKLQMAGHKSCGCFPGN
ncbi:hypothetical protein M569_02979 [Genlisea aurea]|uniref:Remorin C-terminal domain-containing protein n=1 Tax=Genlisea aurea TaxID=192259 RepID=S8D2Z9_9LAMI|nr:hypothetical protein M569_02979 [Genlisea aurea]